MEIGVSIGQPPGNGPPPSFQPSPNQGFYNNDGTYYQLQTGGPQQQAMFQGTAGQPRPQMLSPNHVLPFHNKGIIGYQANPTQGITMQHPLQEAGHFGAMTKKAAYTSDCIVPGTFSRPSAVLYSPNGLTRLQGNQPMQPGKFVGGTVMQVQGQHMPTQSPQNQFHGQMMYQKQQLGPQPQVMWYQKNGDPGMNSPPPVQVRFNGSHGTPGPPMMQMMSPTPTIAPQNRSPGQPAQARHLMSPGAVQNLHNPRMVLQHNTPSHHIQVQTVPNYIRPEHGNMPRPMAPASRDSHQHQHQAYQQLQLHGQLIQAGNSRLQRPIECTQYAPMRNQNSPSIPYSQALEGYPSPEVVPDRPVQYCTSEMAVNAEAMPMEVPCMQPTVGSSVHSTTLVYTMANTHLHHTMTSNVRTIMSGGVQVSPVISPCHTDSISSHINDTGDKLCRSSRSSCEQMSVSSVSNSGGSPNCGHLTDSRDGHTDIASTVSSLTDMGSKCRADKPSDSCSLAVSIRESEISPHSSGNVSYNHGYLSTNNTQCARNSRRPLPSPTALDTKPGFTKHPSLSTAICTTAMSSSEDTGALAVTSSTTVGMLTVPFGWRRVAEQGSIIYYSPIHTRLTSMKAIVDYLTTDGTCKCGLSCPLVIETTFNFDLSVPSRPWTVESEVLTGQASLKSLCNHKRKLIAMATLQKSDHLNTSGKLPDTHQPASKVLEALSLNKKGSGKRKPSKAKSGLLMPNSTHDNMTVDQLFHSRERARERETNVSMSSSLPFMGPYVGPNLDQTASDGMFPGAYDGITQLGQIQPPPFHHRPELGASGSGTTPVSIKVEAGLDAAGQTHVPSDGSSCQKPPLHMQQHMMANEQGDPLRFGGQHRNAAHLVPGSRMHKPQNPYQMFMNARHKLGPGNVQEMPEGHFNPNQGQGQMSFNNQVGLATNQMFSFQLQMQAQAAAARNAVGPRFGMPSPGLSSPSQHGSPSPGHFHITGKMSSPPPFYDQSSPNGTFGPYRSPAAMGQAPGAHVLSPNSMAGSQGANFHQNALVGRPDPAEPATKKKKKKKKKKPGNKTLGSVLDKNIPCPNVDVRQFAHKHVHSHAAFPGAQRAPQAVSAPSFLDNPAAFLAQHTQLMTNKIQSSFTADAPFSAGQRDMALHSYEHPSNKSACNSANNQFKLSSSTEQLPCMKLRSPIPEEDTLAGILSQDTSQSRPSSRQTSDSSPSVTPGAARDREAATSKDFPASCLLSAAARARFIHPCIPSETSSMSTMPLNSWASSIDVNRFKVPSGPAPIRHVPPGGQHIGGGSIVYHHNIENQQAFQEGGIVNGGGILMVSGPASRGDSLYMNCLPNNPVFLQDAMTHKNMSCPVSSNAKGHVARPPSAQVDMSAMKQMHPDLQEPLQTGPTSMFASKEQIASPIQLVENLISGIGSPNKRAITSLARNILAQVSSCHVASSMDTAMAETLSATPSTPVSVSKHGQEDGLDRVNPPMPPLSVAAVTAVTNSITQVIPTVGTHISPVNTTETCVRSRVMSSVTPKKKNLKTSIVDPSQDTTPELKGSPDDKYKEVTQGGQYYVSKEPDLTNQSVQSTQGCVNVQSTSSQAQTTGTLKVKVILKTSKKKKKKKKGKKSKSDVARYAVEHSSQQNVITAEETDHDRFGTDASVHHTNSEDPEVPGTTEEQAIEEAISEAPATSQYPEGIQSTLMLQHNTQILEQTSDQLVFSQSGTFPSELLQGQDQHLAQVCISSQAQDQLTLAQGQATNLIQTVSFVPNMVGIDPSTGLVQSIQMPGTTSDISKDTAGISDQMSPVTHTQVVQTVVQSLHIQNNMLLQGVAASAGTFLQPLGAMGNALIPIFPSPGSVATSSEGTSLSIMQMNSMNSPGQLSPYLEPTRPSSNVVSTQTEAVQTEDSCSDLLDTEGGGRLLVENEQGILADENDLQEPLDPLSPEGDHQGFIYEPEVGDQSSVSSGDAINTPDTLTVSSTGISRSLIHTANKLKDTVGGSLEQDAAYSEATPAREPLTLPRDGRAVFNDPESISDDEHKNVVVCSTAAVSQSCTQTVGTEVSSGHDPCKVQLRLDLDDENDSTVQQDSSLLAKESSCYLSVPSLHSDLSQSDSQSDSQSMPILSREGSSKDLSASDMERKKIVPAMMILHKHLEETVRMHRDDLEHVADDQHKSHQEHDRSNSSSERTKLSVADPAREKSEDPPALSVIHHYQHPIRKRGPALKKCRRAKFRRKGKKVLRASLRLNTTHLKSSCEPPKVQPESIQRDISLNNNKPPDISQNQTIAEDTLQGTDTVKPDKTDTYLDIHKKLEHQEQKNPSTGGSSDGEANQSSDSSQSVVSSEGDEVRHGNSPSIRCSNLLTSSPETNDLNCNSHRNYEQLSTLEDKIFTEGGRNHGRSATGHMKTRRSIRSELENVLPRRAVKRAFPENATHIIDKVDDDSDCMATAPAQPPPTKTFRVGDLIWGPIKNFPSWPGKLVPYSEVPRNPASEPDKLWVHWFGMHTHSQVEPGLLKTLSEGLEAHHSACLKQRKGRKMNPGLESAIEEAMQEFDRPMEPEISVVEPVDSPVPPKMAKIKKILKKKKTK